jgi:LemA protein
MPLPILAGAVLVLIAAWAVYTFNFLVHARTKVREAMSGVDVQLKLRHDLVPNLNEVVSGYLAHEHEALRTAAAWRSRAIAASRPQDVEQAENSLAAGVSGVLAVAEGYPELKASSEFLELATRLREIEDEVQAARELYNSNVEFYNSRAQQLPASLIATWMRPRSFMYLRLDAIEFDAVLASMGEFAA